MNFEIFLGISTLTGLLLLYLLSKRPTAKKKTPSRGTLTVKPIFMMKDCYYEGERRFNLVSYDNGENWKVLELFEEKNPLIRGDVEDFHPAVMHRLDYWEELVAYVKKRGSISLHNNKGVRLLQRCHLDVRKITGN